MNGLTGTLAVGEVGSSAGDSSTYRGGLMPSPRLPASVRGRSTGGTIGLVSSASISIGSEGDPETCRGLVNVGAGGSIIGE
jgi:hypothetical protein